MWLVLLPKFYKLKAQIQNMNMLKDKLLKVKKLPNIKTAYEIWVQKFVRDVSYKECSGTESKSKNTSRTYRGNELNLKKQTKINLEEKSSFESSIN